MTDRELLEMAAKASFGSFAKQMIESGWDPINADSDAFRLAVRLEIDVSAATYDHCERNISDYDDPYEETRRAIVKAAAKLSGNLV